MFQSTQGFKAVLILICLSITFLILPGCTKEQPVSAKKEQPVSAKCDLNLNLSIPELKANNVTLNGGVVAPVNRIQWDWGDGSVEAHRFFPANHTYSKPGHYKITVSAFSAKGCSEGKSVFVDIK